MATAIFKFILEPTDVQIVKLSSRSKILSVMEQHGKMVLYATVDTALKFDVPYTIYIFGTGFHMPENLLSRLQFIGTVNLDAGSLIFHIFYEEQP